MPNSPESKDPQKKNVNGTMVLLAMAIAGARLAGIGYMDHAPGIIRNTGLLILGFSLLGVMVNEIIDD